MIAQICLDEVVLSAAKEVFETMIFMELEKNCESEINIETEALLGSITFKGDIQGCFAVSCSQQCAKTISANMLGISSPDEVEFSDACDAMGEVANMIMGSIKTRIRETVGNVEVSIPSVVSGKQLQNSLGEKATRVTVAVCIDLDHVAELSLLYKGQ